MSRTLLFTVLCICGAALAACDDESGSKEKKLFEDGNSDANLEACLREALAIKPLGIPYYWDLTPSVLATLTHLECRDMGIASINELGHCTNLVSLTLWENEITDLTPLSELTQLEELQLGNNAIFDVSPLAGLNNLKKLGLSVNNISNLGPLSDLNELKWLNLDANLITDVSPIAELNGLTWLTVERNAIENLSVLEDLIDSGCEVYSDYQDGFFKSGGYQNADTVALPGLLSSPAPGFEYLSAESSQLRHWHAARLPGVEAPFPRDQNIHPYSGNLDWTLENSELLPFVFASPNQYDAGSCLYMASTGVAEILMNQHVPEKEILYLGDTDLSERFLMNADDDVPNSETRWSFTDLIYAYNYLGGSMLDRDYPMAANTDGTYIVVDYSWTNDLPNNWEDQLVETPPFERTVIFADPLKNDSSQWNVALMDDSAIERIKYELRTRKAPVIVVYNHYLYWHADIIVGYDDTVETNGCPMVESSLDYFTSEGAGSYVNKIEAHIEALDGCTDSGIFYVRDSIYEGEEEEEVYQYGGPYPFSAKYSKRIIERTYNWVKFLANHVYVVHRS